MSFWNSFAGHCEVVFADQTTHPSAGARAAITHNGWGLFGSVALTPIPGIPLDLERLARHVGEEIVLSVAGKPDSLHKAIGFIAHAGTGDRECWIYVLGG